MITIDTNLLVYAHRAATPQHRHSIEAIERAAASAAGWGVALPSLAEFWMVVTHPSATGRPSTAREAKGFLDRLRHDASMQLFMPRPDMGLRLLDLAAQMGVSGPRIFDLQIGLIALEAGATEIWTHDSHFLAPRGLRVNDPLTSEP